MSSAYNLTVQLNLQGPQNLNSVVNQINKKLGNINANVNVNVPGTAIKQIAQVNSGLKQTAQAAKTAQNSMERFGNAAGLAVKRFAAFTTATAGFYAITRATQESLAKFVEFDRQITRIAQVTNTTRQSLTGLSSEITRLATSLGASSSQLASVAVTLSQAGLSATETQKALQALAKTTLAPTFNDLNQTVEGSIALMKQFNISTNQLEKALGSINAVAGQFAVEASDLITAVQRAGGVFAAASQGVSTGTDALNEFLAVFTSVRATTRESAETIATGLRTIFTRIQREDTISALQAFGVTLTDLEGKFIGPYKAIEQLAKGLGKLDPRSLEFSGIIEELGGFRQVGKVIPLIQRFTTAQQALNAAQAGSGSLAQDVAIGQQSLAVQISKVKEQFDALIRSIGETSEFKQFVRLSLDLASALIKVADAVKPVLPALGALAAIRIGAGIGSFAKGLRGGLGFNSGGLVPGTGNTDTVRANLTPGEYVIRKQAVNAIGVNNLERMNRYASGGKVGVKDLPSSNMQKRIISSSVNEFRGGRRVNAGDSVAFSINEVGVDASPKIGNTAFEKKVAKQLRGKWVGKGNYPVDVVAPGYGAIEVRNRNRKTPVNILADKLARYRVAEKGDVALGNENKPDTINLGRITIAYNTGKIDEKNIKGKTLKKQTKKAKGGPISGQDTVPALLTPGEYVLNSRAASAIGERRLNQLNNADRIGYNSGGPVGRVRFAGGGGAGVGNIAMTMVGLQGAVSALQMTFDQTTKSGAQAAGVLQGFATGLTSTILIMETVKSIGPLKGLVKGMLGPLAKFGGGIGLAVAGVAAFGMAAVNYANAQNELEKKLANEKLSSSMDEVGKAIDDMAKGTAGSIQTFNQNLLNAAQAAEQLRNAQNQYKYSLIGTPLDYLTGADEQTNITRSRILQDEGMFAYFSSLFDPDMVSQKQTEYAEKDRKAAAIQAKEIAKAQIERGSQIIEKGGSMADVARQIPMEIREAMARSNVEVAKQLDQTTDPRRRTSIINQEVVKQLEASLGPQIAQKAAEAANVAVQQLQVALEKVFSEMQQGFKAAAKYIESRFGRVADYLQVSMGQGKIGYDNSRIKSILDNPKAFSDAQVKDVISSAMPLLGPSGGRVGQLALASTRMEDQITSIIDNVVMSGTPRGAQLSTIGANLTQLVSGLNLGADIEQTINEQLRGAFEQARKDLGDNADPAQIRQRVQEIVKNLPALNGALDVVKQALESYGSAQQRYSQVVQQVTEATLKQRDYFNKAYQIGRSSEDTLIKAMGGKVTLERTIGNVAMGVAQQTGGIIDPTQLFYQQRALMSERTRVSQRREQISGRADTANEFIFLTDRLRELDTQLSMNRGGLEMLANSTEIASAALNEYTSIQQQAQQKLSVAEKVATATPSEYADMQMVFSSIENILAGGTLGLQNSFEAQRAMMKAYAEGGNPYQVMEAGQQGLSRQRGAVLSMFKEMQPFFGDSKTFNEQYVTVMRSILNSTGRNNPVFEKMFAEILGKTDRQQQALMVYQQATRVQQQATIALGNMIDPMGALAQANRELANAVGVLAGAMGGQAPGGGGRNRIGHLASGGVVYAQEGQLVNMQPRGTDTVPAMLTPGEFVVNAKATKKHRGLLERINGGGVPGMLGGVAYADNGGFMERANTRYQAYLRSYQENYGAMFGGIMPVGVSRYLQQRAWNDELQEQQRMTAFANYQASRKQQIRNHPASQKLSEIDKKLNSRFMDENGQIKQEVRESPTLMREYYRVNSLSPTQMFIEDQRIRKEEDRARRKQQVRERRQAEAQETQMSQLRKRYPGVTDENINNYLETGDSQYLRKPSQAPPQRQERDDWTPFDNLPPRQQRQTTQETLPNGQVVTRDAQTGRVIHISRLENPFLRRENRTLGPRTTTETVAYNSQALSARANSMIQREEQGIAEREQQYQDAYSGAGVGGGVYGFMGRIGGYGMMAVDYLRGGSSYNFYEDQNRISRQKIHTINYAKKLLEKANDPSLPESQRIKYYKEAEGLLMGQGLNAARYSGGPSQQRLQEYEQEQYDNAMMTGSLVMDTITLGGGTAAVRAGGSAVVRVGGRAVSAARTGAGRAASATARRFGRQGAQTGTRATPWIDRYRGAVDTMAGRGRPGTAATTRTTNGTTITFGDGSIPPSYYPRGTYPHTGPGVGGGPSWFELHGLPNPTGYSSGGIVQPAYLSNGGGAWQFEDLASGYFDYNALNTDPATARHAYSTVGRYASPRAQSYEKIKYTGERNWFNRMGVGYDASGRPTIEGKYGSDPRSHSRSLYGAAFYSAGGLARGSDRYPAMLSRGEMVMNAEATRNNEGILRAMNKSSGGVVRGGVLYAQNGTDGPIGMAPRSGATGSSSLSDALTRFNDNSSILTTQLELFSVSATTLSASFGVFNEGVTLMQQTTSLLGNASRAFSAPITSFGQSIQEFASQTSNLISVINKMGDINGTINVRGQIDFSPIQVEVIGLEVFGELAARVERSVLTQVSTSLANDNPGFVVSSFETSSNI